MALASTTRVHGVGPTRARLARTVIAVVLAAVAVGCGSDAVPACRVGADCASGMCLSNGNCAPAAAIDGGDAAATVTWDANDGAQADATSNQADTALDAPVNLNDAGASQDGNSATPSGVCVPDHNGVVTRAESPIAPGLSAQFRVAAGVSVNLGKAVDGSGAPIWDLGQPLPGDKTVTVKTLDLANTWFGKDFAGATYAVKLTDSADLLGVFELTEKALLLRGVVSPEKSVLYTEITYDPPLPVLQFPLSTATVWSAKSAATGLYNGVMSFWTEQIDMQSVAAGTVKTPLGDFPALRVHGKVQKTLGLLTTTYRSIAFVAECYGVVAKMDSAANEPDDNFSSAAEVRRLTP